MPPKKKRTRTSNDVFCSAALYEALKVFAALKVLAWDWEFLEYGKQEDLKAQTVMA
jgi:hypothetical protein